MVYFINRRFLDQLLGVLRKKHVTIARTVPASAAIIASLLEHCPDAERKQLLYLHIGKDESLIIALQRGNPVLYRKLPMGYSMLTLKENQFILPVGELSASDDLHKISDQLTELGDGFHQLLAEIARCVKGVGIHFGAHGFFDFFHLSGLLTSNDDFSIYLEEFLHIPRLEFILPTEKLAKHQIARGPVWRPLFSLITRDEVKK
jgi:hypothetical protein